MRLTFKKIEADSLDSEIFILFVAYGEIECIRNYINSVHATYCQMSVITINNTNVSQINGGIKLQSKEMQMLMRSNKRLV